MENNSIEHICIEIIQFIKSNLIAESVTIDQHTSLDELGLDSFSIIEIVLFIERRFGYTIPDESLTKQNVHSVYTIASHVHQNLSTA